MDEVTMKRDSLFNAIEMHEPAAHELELLRID